jgi:[ribosomal protein S5]-alanine N-acetyltransferase
MKKIELKKHKVSYAKRLCEILNNPNFIYFTVKPKTVEDEAKWLRQSSKKAKDNFEHNYAIFYSNKLIGGCGIKIDQHRKFIGEIGYFIDEEYWNKGITTKVVKLLEKIGFDKLGLKRITIIMDLNNKASRKVAIKNNYKKEGIMKKSIDNNGKFCDVYLYAKVK